MKYLAALLAVAGLVAADTTPGYDAITKPGQGESMSVGETYDLTWEYNAKYPGTSTVVLIGGASTSSLDPIETLTTSVDNSAGKFSWKVDTIGKAVYGFQIIYNTDNKVYQYSFPFSITPGASTSSTWGSSTTSSSSTKSGKATTTTTTSSGWTKPSGTGNGHWGSSTSDVPYTTTSTTKSWGNGTWPTDDCGCDDDEPTSTRTWATLITPTTTSNGGPIGGGGGSATTASTSIVTAGAATAAAGGVAMLGGLAMAMLAL